MLNNQTATKKTFLFALILGWVLTLFPSSQAAANILGSDAAPTLFDDGGTVVRTEPIEVDPDGLRTEPIEVDPDGLNILRY